MTGLRIEDGGLDDPRVVALLELHVTRARAETAGRTASHPIVIATANAAPLRINPPNTGGAE